PRAGAAVGGALPAGPRHEARGATGPRRRGDRGARLGGQRVHRQGEGLAPGGGRAGTAQGLTRAAAAGPAIAWPQPLSRLVAIGGIVMIRPGLCSVTFRSLPVEEVVRHAAAAGLEGIEWAGDAHVPPGDLDAATHARTVTEEAGLAVTSYGSYLTFVGSDEEVHAAGGAVIAAARALGAPRIRVWATRTGSVETSTEDRAVTVGRIRELADRVAAH